MSFAAPPMRTPRLPVARPASSRLLIALIVIAAATPLSCGKRQTVAGPPVSAPAPRQPSDDGDRTTRAPLSAPQTAVQLPPAQEIPKGAAPARPSFPSASEPEPTPPTRTAPTRTPRPTAPVTAANPPEAPVVEEPSTASDLPQLSPLMSPAKRRAMEAELDQRLAKTRADLQRLMGRSLNGEQVAAVKRIQAFLKQAEDTRAQDLNLAKNLAQRAQVLAEDLVRSAL
jgi:hypothetical protein